MAMARTPVMLVTEKRTGAAATSGIATMSSGY
jgi:hypothetical protein